MKALRLFVLITLSFNRARATRPQTSRRRRQLMSRSRMMLRLKLLMVMKRMLTLRPLLMKQSVGPSSLNCTGARNASPTR
jgi:hypothetical protein